MNQNQKQYKQVFFNPYKNVSALDGNCLVKATFSYFAGGAMGFVLSMFMNAVQMRQIQYGKIRRSTAIVLRKDWRRILSNAKGFATFGGFFVLFECMIEHIRCKDDGMNSVMAGFGTSIVLAANAMRGKDLLFSGMGGGAMCYLFYKVFKMFGY